MLLINKYYIFTRKITKNISSFRCSKIIFRVSSFDLSGTTLKGLSLPLLVGLEHCNSQQLSHEYLSVFVVDAEGDGGGMQEQPWLLLVHLLPQTLHAALTLRRFLHTHIKSKGSSQRRDETERFAIAGRGLEEGTTPHHTTEAFRLGMTLKVRQKLRRILSLI